MGYLFNKFISSTNNENYNSNGSVKFHKMYTNNYKNKNKMFFSDLYSSYTEMIADIIIYVIIVCNILTILFFTLIKDVEGEIVKQQITHLLDDIFSDFDINNTNDIINKNNSTEIQILNKLNNIKSDLKIKLEKQIKDNINTDNEKKIKENNQIIFNKSMIILAVVNSICLLILFGLWKYNKFDLLYYLKKNMILGAFVIITELIFLYIISKNYIYIDKKYVIMQTMKKI